MEYPRPTWTRTFTTTMDLSGTPATVVGPADKLYFAVASKGIFDGTINTGAYNIVLGCINGAGITEWLFRDPSLISYTDDTQPSIALGPTGELYVAFMTPGNIPGSYNGADVLNLCGGCGSTAGRQDIVFARIDGAIVGSPSVAWRIQNVNLNSCNNEYNPHIYVDAANSRVLITYECSGSTLCSVVVGSPNIICSAFTFQGVYQWTYQGTLLNGTGANRSPSVAVDLSGNVYIAYTITNPVDGGGSMQGNQDVEVVRLRQSGGIIVRDWILSATHTINSSGVNADPNLVFDPNTQCLYLAFTATEAVPGGTKTATGADLVLAALNTAGSLVFLHQSPVFNGPAYRYSTIDHPQISLNQYGVVYIAAHAILESTGSDMVLAFKFNPGSMVGWFFRQGIDEFSAYIAASDILAPFQILYVSAPFSAPSISTFAGQVYLTFIRYNSATLYVCALSQNINYLEYNAQQYMRNALTIC